MKLKDPRQVTILIKNETRRDEAGNGAAARITFDGGRPPHNVNPEETARLVVHESERYTIDLVDADPVHTVNPETD